MEQNNEIRAIQWNYGTTDATPNHTLVSGYIIANKSK